MGRVVALGAVVAVAALVAAGPAGGPPRARAAFPGATRTIVELGSPDGSSHNGDWEIGPLPAGDASCDGIANAIDAALVLRVEAGLIEAALCQKRVDVNRDGRLNSVDAALILQFVAGLLDGL